MFEKGYIPWNKGIPHLVGKDNPAYTTGWRMTREGVNEWRKERRHRLGISKRYNGVTIGVYASPKKYVYKNSISKKRGNQAYKGRCRNGGKLTIKTIQLIYEDNIKQFGTLTCVYCFKSLIFGEDSLEHKIPLSRGGKNDYNNLAIACRSCNSSKGKKLFVEWKQKGGNFKNGYSQYFE